MFEKIQTKFSIFNEVSKYPFVLYPKSYSNAETYSTDHDKKENIEIFNNYLKGKYSIVKDTENGIFEWTGFLPKIAYKNIRKNERKDPWVKIILGEKLTNEEQLELCRKLEQSGLTVIREQQDCKHIKNNTSDFFKFIDVCFVKAYGYTIKCTVYKKHSLEYSYNILIKNNFNNFKCVFNGEFAKAIFNTLLRMPRQLSL
ncbi:MAG TPA: hypothetical protein PLZ05_03395 [Alphaproteobacteria bacterium]|nr:hypothetical protein [Alphaproteobacteria bacterium]